MLDFSKQTIFIFHFKLFIHEILSAKKFDSTKNSNSTKNSLELKTARAAEFLNPEVGLRVNRLNTLESSSSES